jgi:hypothetical protein
MNAGTQVASLGRASDVRPRTVGRPGALSGAVRAIGAVRAQQGCSGTRAWGRWRNSIALEVVKSQGRARVLVLNGRHVTACLKCLLAG